MQLGSHTLMTRRKSIAYTSYPSLTSCPTFCPSQEPYGFRKHARLTQRLLALNCASSTVRDRQHCKSLSSWQRRLTVKYGIVSVSAIEQ